VLILPQYALSPELILGFVSIFICKIQWLICFAEFQPFATSKFNQLFSSALPTFLANSLAPIRF